MGGNTKNNRNTTIMVKEARVLPIKGHQIVCFKDKNQHRCYFTQCIAKLCNFFLLDATNIKLHIFQNVNLHTYIYTCMLYIHVCKYVYVCIYLYMYFQLFHMQVVFCQTEAACITY